MSILSIVPDDDDCYTTTPTHLRIYKEETGDEWVWHVDGADNDGRYTEDVRRFATIAEAFMYADLFVKDAETDYGVVWEWDTERSTVLRPNLLTNY